MDHNQASPNIPDLRERPRQSKLPCGASHSYRCQEDCGVIVNAYVLPYVENELDPQ